MERNEIIDILKGMCERCLIKGIISTLNGAKEIHDVFDRFSTNNYKNDNEYSDDIFYLYNLAKILHESGNTSLEESYSIYNAILTADRIDFIEIKEPVTEEVIKVEPIKIKRSKKSNKTDDGVVDISNITV